MASGSQTKNGKAVEYAFLLSFKRNLEAKQKVSVLSSRQLDTAASFYHSFPKTDQDEMDIAADAGVKTIIRLEPKLITGQQPLTLTIQHDSKGQEGDVRDVVAIRSAEGWDVGVSCKNNHNAVKHSRLSATIDVGKSWFGFSSSQDYFDTVIPLYSELAEMKEKKLKWNQVENKVDRYYYPALQALIDELNRLDKTHPGEIPKRLLSYLLGRNDFYKAILQRRSQYTEIQGFNLYGTLNQTAENIKPQLKMPKLKLPNKFYDIHFIEGSKNKILIVMDNGWMIRMRIHNASSKVEKSLKLDVRLEGLPPTLYHHVESW
ncbi:HaeIII family restriction endonuclease [Kroppenstedtia pulmonis]|uniref:HaeIII family restriction endonuclease n=1 Tax=Kroppenstedtia pulmonis TaxID=1380685 RepID=A0A7D3XZU4_9BACL|nr:HaeIII family restriction endonuclease [Kroppenstedtia pulmonis]QKG83303.1 HaeIII family restriction endonuclease [Kroppenstedtia pulmonis]